MNTAADNDNSGEITRLKFKSNPDTSKKDISSKEKGLDEFTVMINPDSIRRVLSVQKTKNRSGRSKSKADVFSSQPEKLSFSFYLDGTNVVPNQKGISVSDQIKNFLNVVYKKEDKPVQSLIIEYFPEESLIVCVDSITINYNLFDKNGSPLRAKIDCSFSTLKEDKPEIKSKKRKKIKSKVQLEPTREPDNTCECVCSCTCDPNEARSQGVNSMKENKNANFSTEDGREIYVS